MVQWRMFRGRLRRAMEDPDPDLVESLAVTADDIERLTGGQVSAPIVRDFLHSRRNDLPPEYLPLLCGIEALRLHNSDYSTRPAAPQQAPKTPGPEGQIRRSQLPGQFSREVKYITIDCQDRTKLREALTERVERAGLSRKQLATCFQFNRNSDIDKFMKETSFGNPYMSHKLQERFWDMCALLNEAIHQRNKTTASQMTTEEFVLALLKEGTVYDPTRCARHLKHLSDFVNGLPSTGRAKS